MRILLLSMALATLVHAAEKPRNVVVILADDLGVKDINIDGSNPFYETPNLAKFAKTAVNFTNGYSSCPVCSPTRSAMLTGQNPARTHNTDYFGAPNEYFGEIPADYDPARDFLKSEKDKKGRDRRVCNYTTFRFSPWCVINHAPNGTGKMGCCKPQTWTKKRPHGLQPVGILLLPPAVSLGNRTGGPRIYSRSAKRFSNNSFKIVKCFLLSIRFHSNISGEAIAAPTRHKP